MAHTNPGWPTNIPPGSDAANTADDQLRRLRLDLLERMNDFVVSFTADPVVLKSRSQRVTTSAGTGAAVVETDLHALVLAANSLGATGGIRFITTLDVAGSAGAKTIKVYFGLTVLATIALGASYIGRIDIIAHIFNRGVTNSQIAVIRTTNTQVETSYGTGNQVIHAIAAVDTTLGVTVKATGQTDNAADEVKAELTIMEIMN